MEYLKRFALWFISGIALALGVALVAWIDTRLEKPKVPQFDSIKPLSIDTVHVSVPVVVPFSDTLSVASYISSPENVVSGKSRLDVMLQLNILQNGQVIYSCGRRSYSYTHPGQQQRVQVDCNYLRVEKVPKNATLSLEVTGVEAWPP